MIKYKKAKESLESKLGKNLNDDELSKYLNISKDDIIKLNKLLKQIVSLNGLDESTISIKDTFELAKNDLLKHEIIKAINISSLTKIEIAVLLRRYGLFGYENETLNEVSDELGISIGTTRTSSDNAIKKLRHPKSVRILKDYY